MIYLVRTLISGLSLGSIYALMALGYTMVYGVAKMLNFAHGDIIMVGAYSIIVAVSQAHLPPLAAVLISVAVCACLGVTVEFLAYRPLRQAPPLNVLIRSEELFPSERRPSRLRFGTEGFSRHRVLPLPQCRRG